MTNNGKKIKISIEWDGKTYIREDLVLSTESDVNPGDKTLAIMGEILERMMIEILTNIVEVS